MTEMLFFEWCELCVNSVEGYPDLDDQGCFECMFNTINENKVSVRKPRFFVEADQ